MQKPSIKTNIRYIRFLRINKIIRSKGINHNNIILDPGIGFGKNLKHNMSLIHNISIFHSLGFPILVGNLEKDLLKIYLEKMIVKLGLVKQ